MTDPTRLTDRAEVLRRQVHPAQMKHDGTPSSEAFRPNPGDAGMMSTLRGSVEAAEAHRRHVEDHQRESVGTWGLSVGEVDDVELAHDGEVLRLQALDDAGHVGLADHASVDFTNMEGVVTRGKLRQVSRKLSGHANARGRLHP